MFYNIEIGICVKFESYIVTSVTLISETNKLYFKFSK